MNRRHFRQIAQQYRDAMSKLLERIRCGRCGRETGAIARVLTPPGWFELEPGDWRCGCILKEKPTCDAEAR